MKLLKEPCECGCNDFKVIKRKTKKRGEAGRVLECKNCRVRIGPSIVDPYVPSLKVLTAVKNKYIEELMSNPAISGVGIGLGKIIVFLKEDSQEIREKYKNLDGFIKVDFIATGPIIAAAKKKMDEELKEIREKTSGEEEIGYSFVM
jgi:hypothetical protein